MSGERLRTSALDYALGPGRIAREPAVPRDSARMMVVDRAADRVEHRHVRDLPEYLRPSDVLIVNRTNVMRARLKLRRVSDNRETEGLLEVPLSARRWRAFIREARRFRVGDRLELVPPTASPDGAPAVVTVVGRANEGFEIDFGGQEPIAAIVERCGWTPLPPYIRRAREISKIAEDLALEERDHQAYQTVYARTDRRVSIAAPTAGLHFTDELLARIEAMGVRRAELTLQVGAGTFKPITTEFVDEHPIHGERYEVPAAVMALLGEVEPRRASGGVRVIAVGTTSVRTLESLPESQLARDLSGEATIMITPATRIRRVDGLLTNFHLPKSSLLALVAAFLGLERLQRLYDLAQREGYRFYSFGDAMLIL